MSLVANNGENLERCEKVELLHKAVINYLHGGSFSTTHFEGLLKLEGDINYKIPDGSGEVTNILHAVYERLRNDRHDIFKSLLNNGADFTFRNSKGLTVVHEIIHGKYKYEYRMDDSSINRIDSILSAHVKFHNCSNPSDNDGFTHFHAACMRDHVEAVQFFLENGVDVNLSISRNSTRDSSLTPLHFAVQYECPNVMGILLKYGANMHTKNVNGYNSLHMIIEAKMGDSFLSGGRKSDCGTMFKDFLKFFIAHDDEADEEDEFGFCKLHAACLLEDPLIAEGLLARVTNLNQSVNSDSPIYPGYTALHFAASCNVKIFELLVKNGADIRVKDASGVTSFDLLLYNSKVDQILTILSMKPEWKNILFSDCKIKLLDLISALESYDNIVFFFSDNRSVLESHIPFDSPLFPGYTVLHLIVAYNKSNGNSPSVLCLQAGADMTVKNTNGSTPLHLAFYLQKNCLVNLLLDNLQPHNPTDDSQLSHLHIACAAGHLQAVQLLLLKKGVDVNLPVLSTFKYRGVDRYDHETRIFFITPGSTALHINTARGDKRITKILLKHGADVNAQDANGFTPVHRLFSGNFDREIRNLLLSNKNLKNIISPCGLSHLHVASYFNHNDAISKLLKLGADVNVPVMFGEYNWKISESYRISIDPYGIPHRPLASLSNCAGNTPLHFHSYLFCRGTRLLLEKNSDLLAKNNKGICPLQNIIEKLNEYSDYSEIINRNITAQTYLRNEYGITMLHVNCFSANDKLVKTLLKSDANVNAKVDSCSPIWRGYTPLHCVIERLMNMSDYKKKKSLFDRLKKIVPLLVEHGADVLLENDNHDTPFHMIYRKLDLTDHHNYYVRRLPEAITLVSLLFENFKNFNVNPINNNGLSLFHIACLVFHVDAVRKFLESGVDINQATRYFSRNCPGSTALHLAIVVRYLLLKVTDSDYEAFIKVVDLLLEHDADVNARDIFGDTPLFAAIRLGRRLSVRPRLIEKLISHGADIHTMNHCCETAFELLLKKQKNATWEELELFLNASPEFLFNMYSQSLQGYLGLFFRFYRDFNSLSTVMDIPIVRRVVDYPRIIEIASSGRSVIHNIVCVDQYSHDTKKTLRYTVRRFPFNLFMSKPVQKPDYWRDENYRFYKDLIEQLVIRGCDIDQQDNEGKTALHLSMDYENSDAIKELLRNGADVNIMDNHGKTAFHQYKGETFSLYVYKMKFCGLHVDKQNDISLDPAEFQFLGKEVERFHEEMDQTKSLNIGITSLSLYEFLMRNDIGTVYMNMTYEERQEVDQFFEKIDEQNFVEIDCMLKLKYRTIIERMKLLCPALEALSVLMKNELPDLCAQIVFKSLSNQDLKRLIASVE